MEPNWVRAVYLHVMAFVGVVIIVFGTLGFALGVVHTAAPQLKSGDPFTSIASSLVNIAGAVANTAKNNGEDVPPSVTKGIKTAKDELHKQSRNHAIDEMLRGLFMALIGLGVYLFHIRRTDAGRPRGGMHPDYAAGFTAGLAAPHEPSHAPPLAPPHMPPGPTVT